MTLRGACGAAITLLIPAVFLVTGSAELGDGTALTQPAVSISVGTGSVLPPSASIRISVNGLSPELAQFACVTVRARPPGAPADVQPLFACTGGSFVALLGPATCEVPRGYDGSTLSGWLQVPWNANQHFRGPHQIRAEVLLCYPGNVWGWWGETDWVDVILSDGPSRLVTLDSPHAGAVFSNGETIAVTGSTQPTERLQGVVLRVTRSDGLQLSTWLISGTPSADGRFAIAWSTQGMLTGQYELQVICRTPDGREVSSHPVNLTLRPDLPPACPVVTANGTLIADGELIEVEMGEPIQFCIHGDPSEPQCQFGSMRWVFATGHESAERCPRHAYASPGQYAVGLNVFSAPGLQGDALLAATFRVSVQPRKPLVSCAREMLGFPDPCAGRMTVLPGIPVSVRVRVMTSASVESLAIREILPEGWGVSDETPQSTGEPAPYRILPMHRVPDEASAVSSSTEPRYIYTWLVLPLEGSIPAGTSIEVFYAMIPPTSRSRAATGSAQADLSLQGIVRVRSTAEGDQEYPLRGDTSLSVVDRLSIPVAVAHMARDGNIEARGFGPEGESPTYLITADQLDQAVHLLAAEGEVPFTGRRLTPDDVMVVNSHFHNRIPVTECLR